MKNTGVVMMNQNKQFGKGLAGFFVGLLLATAVIAGVLFFLNKSNKTAIKTASQPRAQEKTEILVPGSGSSMTRQEAPQASAISDKDRQTSGAETKPGHDADTPPTTAVIPPSAHDHDHLAGSQADTPPDETGAMHGAAEAEQQVKSEQQIKAEQLRQQQLKKQAEADRLAKLKKQEEAKKKLEAKEREQTKPSPEQILNSGNMDKARQQAGKDDAERKKAEDALNGRTGGEDNKAKADKPSAVTKKSGKVVIQVGSYGNKQAADAQRAKLAMIGVSAQVVEGQAGDKSIYRVQTGELSSDAAAAVRKKLQQNGVQSLTRSVQ